MKRIMCMWFPNWPIQRRWLSKNSSPQPPPRSEEGENFSPLRFGEGGRGRGFPLVLHAPSYRGKVCVVACSHHARRHGVAPGMLLAEAQALCPLASRFEAHDPHADREILRQLALGCEPFSPRVAVDTVDPPDGLLLDVTGCGYGFGGEEG